MHFSFYTLRFTLSKLLRHSHYLLERRYAALRLVEAVLVHLYVDGGATAAQQIAHFFTSGTQIIVPPGLLAAGQSYFFRIRAIAMRPGSIFVDITHDWDAIRQRLAPLAANVVKILL